MLILDILNFQFIKNKYIKKIELYKSLLLLAEIISGNKLRIAFPDIKSALKQNFIVKCLYLYFVQN